MELRHLRYFVAVAEALSFRKAAERLRIAQPALSKQIKDLEREIGAPLLDRNTRGVALTDAGGVFLDEARDILERVEMATNDARDASTGLSGRLLIANLGTLTASFLPAALSEFKIRYPKVDINLRDLSLQDQMVALRTGAIQIGFHLNQSGIDVPCSIESRVMMESRIAIAMCYQHRLANQAEVSLADLVEEDFLCAEGPGRNDLHRQRTHAILSNRGLVHRPVKQVGSFESLLTLVAGNHGIALLIPTVMARRTERIVFRRIRENGGDLHIVTSVLWRKGAGSPLARNFVEVLKGLPVAME